jgi:predicted NUDIX family NTP pyrophosphohydrolase
MAKHSAGILPFRKRDDRLEVFLAHPGGPYWKNKDEGAWMIIKGEFDDEDPLEAAKREFREETGFELKGPFKALEPVKQSGGKVVHAFAAEQNLDTKAIESNTFEMEWPPKSGKKQSFPEIDRAAWFGLDEARVKMLKSQRPLLDQLERLVRTT